MADARAQAHRRLLRRRGWLVPRLPLPGVGDHAVDGVLPSQCGEIASVGVSIESKASALDPAVRAMSGVAGVGEPAETSRALGSMQVRWSAGVGRLQDDLELLGRGVQAASTLYTHTDESAMGAE